MKNRRIGGIILTALLFAVVMSTMMIPWAVTIIPQYEMFTNWGLQDTYTSLVLPGMISAFGIFLFRQSIAGIATGSGK